MIPSFLLYETFSNRVKYWRKELIRMVKGISKQVIVVNSPDKKLFEQAIFILNENTVGKNGVTDDILLKEAKQALRAHGNAKHMRPLYGPLWACGGALVTGIVWLFTMLL